MWYNRPAHTSYTPYGYGYSGYQDPYAIAAARERAAREQEAAARRAELLRWQQMQDATRSTYNSYLSDDDDDDSYIPYPYGNPTHRYTPYVNEDLRRRQILEQQRQLELARQAELKRRRDSEHSYKPQQLASTSAPHLSIPISSPKESPSELPFAKPTQSPKHPSPQSSPKPVAPEATPEQIRAAMTIQDFYRRRIVRQQALASIAELSTEFEQFKSTFSPPPQLDYRGVTPDETITVSVSPESFAHASSIPPFSGDAEDGVGASKSNPPLAFTTNNKTVHEYIENLNRLLVKLDRIESGGHTSVREQRKQMIRNVEAEAQRMDRWIEAVWTLARPQAQPNPRLSHQLRPQPTMEDVFAKN